MLSSTPDRIFNIDNTGPTDTQIRHASAKRSKRQVGKISSAEKGKSVKF